MTGIEAAIHQLFPGITLLDALLFFALIFTRFLVMTLVMPIFGAELLPALVRVALAGVLSMVAFVLVHEEALSLEVSLFVVVLLFLKEALLGFILGFFSSLIFYVYELFGELVDMARAASMSKLLVPELKHQSSALGSIFFQLALVLFFQAGFHREVIETIYKSFKRFPVASLTGFINPDLFKSALFILGSLFQTALSFALPVILICFLIDVAFGLLNRVAPQINAYFLSLPTKMLAGLIMLFFMLPFLLEDFFQHYQELARFLANIILL